MSNLIHIAQFLTRFPVLRRVKKGLVHTFLRLAAPLHPSWVFERRARIDFFRSADPSYWEQRAVCLVPSPVPPSSAKGTDIVVIIDVDHPDVLDEAASAVRAMAHTCTVYVCIGGSDHEGHVQEAFRSVANATRVQVIAGRAHGALANPRLSAITDALEGTDVVAFLEFHQKEGSFQLRGQRRYCLSTAFGSPDIVAAVCGRFQSNPDLGLLFPAPFLPLRTTQRYNADVQRVRDFLHGMLGAKALSGYQPMFFPTGSVMWMRGSLIANLVAKLAPLRAPTTDPQGEGHRDETVHTNVVKQALPALAKCVGYTSEEFYLEGSPIGESPGIIIPDEIDCLIMDHNLGGGTRLYTDTLITQWREAGKTTHRLYYDPKQSRYLLVQHGAAEDGMWSFRTLGDLADQYEGRALANIVVNSLAQFPSPGQCVDLIVLLKQRHQVAISVNFHDFYSVCPSQHLLDASNRFCNVPADPSICASCAATSEHMWHFGGPGFDIDRWREPFRRLFALSDELVLFDASSKAIVQRAHQVPDALFQVRPHKHPNPFTTVPASPARPLHIGLIGLLHRFKGVDQANALARYVADGHAGTKITLVGWSPMPLEPHIQVTGPYELVDLPGLVERSGITVFFIASIVPETFCYTLDEIMALGLPVVSYALGAQGRRTPLYQKGCVMDPDSRMDEVYAALSLLHSQCHAKYPTD